MFEKKKKDCSTLKPTTHTPFEKAAAGAFFLIEGTKDDDERACQYLFFDFQGVLFPGGVYFCYCA